MGIAKSVLTKVGLPLIVVVAAGLILASQKDRIIAAVKAGSETLGQTLTQPIASFIGGAQTGLSNIPSIVTIPFPRFEFTLGGQTTTKDNKTAIDEAGRLDINQANRNLCRNTLGVICLGESRTEVFGSTPPPSSTPTTPPAPAVIPPPTPALTIIRGGSLPVGTNTGAGQVTRKTREQIIAENPNAVGLFDLLSTSRTEFLPLSPEAVSFFQGQGQQLRLSGQIFQQIKNVGDVV